ncbi:MAG: hypothetical protein GWN93_05760 [Deltaproteobacteria bacterium]|nr:hypothetical protein [Deltaproteobacteria bacterium]
MPYDNVPEEKWGAMDSCVEKVMADHSGEEGFTKENAIQICYTRIVGSTDVAVESAEVHFEVVTDPTDVNMALGQSFEPGELLRWKNAELARAEVNSNMDELSNEDIVALASTLPLMPLTDEHSDTVVGMFTAASSSPAPDSDTMRLITEGVMYARRFPDVADAIRSGVKRLSVEAFADTAVCSICGGEFHNMRAYCTHLKDRHASGASRRFKGIRAVGGGAVRRPAGSTAGFDREQVYMIAHVEDLEAGRGEGAGNGGERQGDGGAGTCVCPECGATAQHEKSVPCSEHKCPKCGTAMGGQSVASSDTVPDQESSEPEGGDNSMTREEIQAQLDKALADLESLKAEKEGVEAERDGLAEQVTSLEASVSDLEGQLADAREAQEQAQQEVIWRERCEVLGSVFTEEQLAEQKATIMAMSDEAVQLFVKAAENTTQPPGPTTMTANLDDDDVVEVTLK